MSALALQDADGDQIGFVLFAGDAPLSTVGRRECIFCGFPLRPELLDSALGSFVQRLKHTEFEAQVIRQADAFVVTVDCGALDRLEAEATSGAGKWVAIHAGERIGQGLCRVLLGDA